MGRAEQAVLERTAWTSQVTKLEAELRGAALTVAKAERRIEATLEDQWVKVPVSGLVSDIRIVEVTTKGVTLELVMLEQEMDLAKDGLEQDAPSEPVNPEPVAKNG